MAGRLVSASPRRNDLSARVPRSRRHRLNICAFRGIYDEMQILLQRQFTSNQSILAMVWDAENKIAQRARREGFAGSPPSML